MILTTTGTDSNTNGNGQFGSLLRNRKKKRDKDTRLITSYNLEDYTFIGKNDRRMRFNNTQDPIYYVFDVIENRPIKTLAKEFVKDTFKDVCSYFSSNIIG